MKALILLSVLLLALAAPASAGWEQTSPVVKPPEWEHHNMIYASMILYNVPGTGEGLISLNVSCTWEQHRCTETKAGLTTGSDPTGRWVPAQMLVNEQGTKAVVTLLDGSGSVITWRAIPGEQRTYHQDDTNRGKVIGWFDVTRSIYESIHNYSYATGTILGGHFDTREMPWLDWSWVQIATIFQRWLPAPVAGPNHEIPVEAAK